MKTAVVVILFSGIVFGQAQIDQRPGDLPQQNEFKHGQSAMNDIYKDESHCLALPEIRNDKDSPISCYCRDAVVDARYVYFTYFLGKDVNLSGVVLALEVYAGQMCRQEYDVRKAAESRDWKWDGPEVVRTYPPQDVIERIIPEKKDGKPTGRWIPYSVQLVYRDAQGRVTRTDNYSGRDWEPVVAK